MPFLGKGSPTRIDYRKKGTLILTSLLEDLAFIVRGVPLSINRKKGSHFFETNPTVAFLDSILSAFSKGTLQYPLVNSA